MFFKTISVLALIASICSATYVIAHGEFGVIFGTVNYAASVENKLDMHNSYRGLQTRFQITIDNSGTLPLRISKIAGMIQLGSHYHVFSTRQTFNIAPQTVWSQNIILTEELPNKQRLIRDKFGINMHRALVKKYRRNDDNNSQIVLPDKLYQQAGTPLDEQTQWMRPDHGYHCLLILWINNADGPPSIAKLYQFSLPSWKIRGFNGLSVRRL